ncbi:MAG: class I SAM-dependent methyltransferase [Candidatus Izemoplasmataceae bacterium]
MKLYNLFVEYYDTIFPLKEPTLRFLSKHLSAAKKVLDIGCATGNIALNLSNNKSIHAIDLSEAMIKKAKDKNQHHAVHFEVKNMLEIEDHSVYEGIYMVGNTLVHLTNLTLIEKMIEKIYKALKVQGKFIIQIINYDRILAKNIDHLPTIDQGGVTFIRNYQFNQPLIHFNTTLHIKDKVINASTPLYPLTKDELLTCLENVGFKDIKLFGDYQENPYHKDTSFHLIVVAKK